MPHPSTELSELLLLAIVADSLDQRFVRSPILSHAETLGRPYKDIADAAIQLLDRGLIRPVPWQNRLEILPAAFEWIHMIHRETMPPLLPVSHGPYIAESLLLIRLSS